MALCSGISPGNAWQVDHMSSKHFNPTTPLYPSILYLKPQFHSIVCLFLMSILCCFDYCSFVAEFKIGEYYVSIFFSIDYFISQCFFNLRNFIMNFVLPLKISPWDSHRNYIESVHCFWLKGQLKILKCF